MTRTALQICQDAAVKLGLDQPSVLFASTDRTEIELRRALIEAADKIHQAHDWQALLKLETHTGDGVETEFPLPSDWLRMPKDARVWSTKWQNPLERISPEEWLISEISDFELVSGVWTIFGGNFVHRPALDTAETARFWYVTNNVVLDAGGTPKPEFTADDDTFRLDDRVLELVMIAQWRRQKSLDYSEEAMDADSALSKAIDRDKGARMLTQASRPRLYGQTAYPWRITP